MSRAQSVLAVRRSVSAPARGERIAWLVLAVLACMVAHEATYQLLYPGTSAYRAAMTLMGHDGYWLGLSVAVAVATIVLVGVAAAQLRRLHREASSTPALAMGEGTAIATYLRLVAATWLPLAILATLVYTAQENLEALGAGLPLRGLDVILGHGLLPLLVILAATLLMALAVALVRWRRRVLLGRLVAAARPWSRHAASPRRASAVRRLPVLHLGGTWASRAPPRVASTIAL
jgi:uncharacterized membrane protein